MSGGKWSGDYLVSPLRDRDEGQGKKRRIRTFRIKEIVFDLDPLSIRFPMREVLDGKTHTITAPKEDPALKDATPGDDGDFTGENLDVKKDAVLPADSVITIVDEVKPPKDCLLYTSPSPRD